MAGDQQSATQLLGSLPFGSLIGGPLTAAVEAQAEAAKSSVDFIKAVGFDGEDGGEVRNVTFNYKKPDGTQGTLEVPLLTIVPIPFIRIDDLSIQFKANISSSTETTRSTSSSKEASATAEASARYLFFQAKMNGSVSSKKDSTSTATSKYAVEYTIDVNVHAVQDDMPKGMATVLGILNESIREGSGVDEDEKPKPKPK